MADTTTELEVLDQIVDVLGGQSGQYETVVPVLQQIKELLASGITDPESIAEAVAAWLDEHPEATTTVQDGSITGLKLAEDVIELLDDKADIDGYYSQLTAGLAENLIGRGDAVPAEYLYRTAGGTADIEDGIATIDCIKGNTLVWNQMVQNGNFTSDTGWQTGTSTHSVANGVITISNTTSSYTVLARTTGTPLVAGHKYYIGFTASSTGGSVMIIPTQGGAGCHTTISGISSKKRVGWIYVPSSEGTFYAGLRFPVTTAGTSEEITSTIEDYITVDLTRMFGEGNEPATVEEFEALFPLPYYPYSAPKLLPVDIRGVETVGFNAYNPSTGEAELLGGHHYQISGTYTQLSYSTGESIALDSDGIFTPSDNGTLTVTGGNATDTCVHLVWSGYRNGEYEEHWSAERPIDTSRFFPTGLKKVGDKADALYADHYDTVIGAVDLGTLDWRTYTPSSGKSIFRATLATSANYTGAQTVPNARCANYETVSLRAVGSLTTDKELSLGSYYISGPNVYVSDSTYTDAADFKAAMSGVILYYELATPTTMEIDPPLNLSYKVSDFGTERIMVDETADAPQSAPVPMEVEYGINATDTIRRLPKEYQSHKSMGQLTAALESSLGVDITETWDETEQRYEYEIGSLAVGTDDIEDGAVTYAKLAADVRENMEAADAAIAEIDAGKTQDVETLTPSLTANKAINYATGAEVSGLAATFAVTDYIPVANAVKIVNTFFGYGTYGFAFYDADKVFIEGSGNKNVQTITAIPTGAKYIRFTDYVSSGTHDAKTVTITTVYETAMAIDNMIAQRVDKLNNKVAHFSFDDCIFWDDLTQNAETYTSAFDNTFLGTLKTLHDTYGLKFTLFCFIVNGSNSIADVTSKFAAEFRANKDWLRFGFHGTTTSETFSQADASTVLGYYNTFVAAIYQMTGDYDCIDRVIRTSSFSGSKAVCTALRDAGCGVRGFLCNDGSGGSYYMGGDANSYINANCKYFDPETQLTFIHSMSRIEGSTMSVDYLKTLAQQNHLPVLEFFSHQDQFTANPLAKTQAIASWLNDSGFTHNFAQYALML